MFAQNWQGVFKILVGWRERWGLNNAKLLVDLT